MLKIIVTGAAALFLLAGCASGFKSAYDKPDGKTLIVLDEDWGAFQEYLNQVGATNKGAFAMAVIDGRSAGWAYSDCPGSSCFAGPAHASKAMGDCRTLGAEECIIFALNSDIIVNYRRQPK